MNCRRAVKFLCFDVGEDLDADWRSAVAEHVAICPTCCSFETARPHWKPRSLRSLPWSTPRELRRRVWREIQKDRIGRIRETRRGFDHRRSHARRQFSCFQLSASRPRQNQTNRPHAVSSAIASAPVPAGPARERADVASPGAPEDGSLRDREPTPGRPASPASNSERLTRRSASSG